MQGRRQARNHGAGTAPEAPEPLPERALTWLLVALTALAAGVCAYIASPFFPALAWGLALAVLGHPLHERIARRVTDPNAAAGLTVAIVAAFIVAPATLVARELLAPVFIAVVGGVITFGASGVVLGPVILAIMTALLELWRRRARLEAAA